MVSEFILLLFIASGGVETVEKGVIFWVILANRLSAAVECSDRDGINCIRERNVPSQTY